MADMPESYEYAISGTAPAREVYRRDKYHDANIFGIKEGDLPKVVVHYGLHAPFCVTATEATPHIYRRSLSNIRRDRADYYILFAITSGSARFLYDRQRSSIGRGGFFLARANVPYEIMVLPGIEDRYCQICVCLPADLAAEFDVGEWAGIPIISHERDDGLALDLTYALFKHGMAASAPASQSLLRAILHEVRRTALVASSPKAAKKSSLRDMRRDAILAFLDSHCTNPDLRAAMVAEACQLSIRYMSALLAENDKSFSGLVRAARLQRLRSWLGDRTLASETITSLAYRAGFSSASHCIASFRRQYGCTPSRLRRDLLAPTNEVVSS